MLKKILRASVAGMALLSGVATAADNGEVPMLMDIKRLTLEAAYKVAMGAIEHCRAEGVQVAVTVVDRAGHPQVVLRDVLATDLPLTVSQQKAYTAMSFRSPTSALAKQFTEPFSVAKVAGVLPSAGGLPIIAGGATVGGVGVSGAPSGELDERCAQAGVDAVQMELEMEAL
jgi:uncharacterized protein GlcG (DUF336 family)